MSSVSSSSSCHPPAGGIVGWSVDSKTVERAVLAAGPHIPSALANLIGSYVPKQEGVFAENDWNELCGRVAPAPPLPENIEEIWEGPCHIFPDKKVKDTHVLVYLPTTVDDKPLTLKTIGEIAKRFFLKSDKGYRYILDKIEKQMGNQPVTAAGWILMTKTVIDGSRNASYAIQQTMITELAKKAKVAYNVPSALEATICILTHYMRTGTRLFSNNPFTYTRCQESIDGYKLVVGGFSPVGLDVDDDDFDFEDVVAGDVGVAALRKFLGH